MNSARSKDYSLNPVGQRSITSTFLFRSSKKSAHTTASTPSLSDFLNHKLHRNCVLPSSVQGKHQSILSSQHDNVTETKAGSRSLSDGAIHMFKNVGLLESHIEDSNAAHNSHMDSLQNREKRKSPVGGYDEDWGRSGKRLAVLGEGSKVVSSCGRSRRPSVLYNHYENGVGWWDDNREGVDNEELGNKDEWEGFSSATVGAFEWN